MSTLIFTAGVAATVSGLVGGERLHARPGLATGLVLAGFVLALLSGAAG